MVHALNRTRRWLAPDGRLIDVHPADAVAHVEVCTAAGNVRVGEVLDESDAKGPLGRHHAADLALDEAIAGHEWIREARATFAFASEADSAEEIDEHLRRKWRAARLDAETRDRVNVLLRANPGAIVRVIESVIITRIRPRKT